VRARVALALGGVAVGPGCVFNWTPYDPRLTPPVVVDVMRLPDGRLACPPSRDDCDGEPANGCEVDLSASAAHCGACLRACTPRDHEAVECVRGVCVYTCDLPFDDCDMLPNTGCERNLATDREHCGTCTTACGAAQNCLGGYCR
jgi:hypothetical protein